MDDDQQSGHMSTPTASALYQIGIVADVGDSRTNNTNYQHRQEPIIVQTGPSNLLNEVRAANSQSELTRANAQLRKYSDEIYELKQQLEAMKKCNEQLTVAVQETARAVRAEYEEKLAAQSIEANQKVEEQRRLTNSMNLQCQTLRFELQIEMDKQRMFQQQLSSKLNSIYETKMCSTNNKNTEQSILAHRLTAEFDSINENIAREVAGSRKRLLDRILLAAAAEVERELKACLAQPSYLHHVAYFGYRGVENFVRNECLFGGVSSVEKSFFLKCADRHLAKAIDPVTGELNKDLFYFTFHGTKSLAAVRAIQCEGYDPACREAHGFGLGEYQGVSNVPLTVPAHAYWGFGTALSHAYGTVLVNLVFKPPVEEVECDNSIHENLSDPSCKAMIACHGPVKEYQGVLIVKNPSDRKDGTYMLPLGCIYNVEAIRQGAWNSADYLDENGNIDPLVISMAERTCACVGNVK